MATNHCATTLDCGTTQRSRAELLAQELLALEVLAQCPEHPGRGPTRAPCPEHQGSTEEPEHDPRGAGLRLRPPSHRVQPPSGPSLKVCEPGWLRDGGSVAWFRPRGRRAFCHATTEEVPTGVDRAGCSCESERPTAHVADDLGIHRETAAAVCRWHDTHLRRARQRAKVPQASTSVDNDWAPRPKGVKAGAAGLKQQ